MAIPAMRALLHILLALGTVAAAPDCLAYCVRNALKDRPVHASILGSRAPPPAKLFSESVEAGKEFCCNPKNADCNPDRVGDQGSVAFDAKVETSTTPIDCGVLSADPHAPRPVEVKAPVRGFLRFELNTTFDARKPPAPGNAPFLLKALTADNRLVATYTCPPSRAGGSSGAGAVSETPRS
jgi:hypothetical protein